MLFSVISTGLNSLNGIQSVCSKPHLQGFTYLQRKWPPSGDLAGRKDPMHCIPDVSYGIMVSEIGK